MGPQKVSRGGWRGILKIEAFPQVEPLHLGAYCSCVEERSEKIAITFRLDPKLKQVAKRVTKAAKQTFSRYIEQLIRLDLWRKGLLM